MSGLYKVVNGKKKKLKLNRDNEQILEFVSENTGLSENDILNGIVSSVTDDEVSGDMAAYFAERAQKMRDEALNRPVLMRPVLYRKMDDYKTVEQTAQLIKFKQKKHDARKIYAERIIEEREN